MIGSYLVKNPFLFFYLNCLDFFFIFIKFFKTTSVKKSLPEKILIVQLAHKGDVIIATSVLSLIKKTYPSAKIGMLIGNWSKDILHNHPLIDYVHVFDHPKLNRSGLLFIKKLLLSIRQLFQLLKELKNRCYDVSIDLSCYYPNSHFLTWSSKIPRRIGYKSGGGSSLLTDSIKWVYQRKHMSLYHLDLLKCLNITSTTTNYLKSYLPDYSSTLFEELEKKYKIKKPFLIFHPYSGNPLKHWSNTNWKKLTQSFINSSYTILFTGGTEKERALIKIITNGIDGSINLANKLSFQELQALVYSSSAIVSVDTMVGHLAANYDIPSITLHCGISDPMHWKPASKKNISLYYQTNCFPCFKRQGCLNMDCIKNISVQHVLENLKKLISL